MITLRKDEEGAYSLLEYQEPLDGAMLTESLKKLFPPRLHSRVLKVADNERKELIRQQETQATEYLKSIGRSAEVRAAHVKKELAELDVEASNKLFSEFTKYNQFLNDCPYWLGTREKVEEGVRYIYETSQGKSEDGYDLITFRKTKEDGTVVKEVRYKIIGSEPQLMP